MHPGDIVKEILQVLRDPAWQGAGVVISFLLSIIALRRSRQPINNKRHHAPSKKEVLALLDANNYPHFLLTSIKKSLQTATRLKNPSLCIQKNLKLAS